MNPIVLRKNQNPTRVKALASTNCAAKLLQKNKPHTTLTIVNIAKTRAFPFFIVTLCLEK